MNETKHTPGPWNTGADLIIRGPATSGAELEYNPSCVVARVDVHYSRELAAANARLIAAAPDLLEACEQAEYWLNYERVADDGCEPIEMLRVLRAVIARATGGATPCATCLGTGLVNPKNLWDPVFCPDCQGGDKARRLPLACEDLLDFVVPCKQGELKECRPDDYDCCSRCSAVFTARAAIAAIQGGAQ